MCLPGHIIAAEGAFRPSSKPVQMPKRKPDRAVDEDDPGIQAERLTNVWVPIFTSFISLWGTIVNKVGRSATYLLFIYLVVYNFATKEQQNQAFQLYVLGDGTARVWPYAAIIIPSVAIVLAQKWRFAQKEREMQLEIDRLTIERNTLQELLAGTGFTHVPPK